MWTLLSYSQNLVSAFVTICDHTLVPMSSMFLLFVRFVQSFFRYTCAVSEWLSQKLITFPIIIRTCQLLWNYSLPIVCIVHTILSDCPHAPRSFFRYPLSFNSKVLDEIPHCIRWVNFHVVYRATLVWGEFRTLEQVAVSGHFIPLTALNVLTEGHINTYQSA